MSSGATATRDTSERVASRDEHGRDARLRDFYLAQALPAIPRLLGAIDRNPLRATYGCLDRQFWHYRTSSFPSEMYQEGLLALALVYVHPLPGNVWHAQPRVRELCIAGLRYSAQASHADGSCDDYYPHERALGAAVFSLQASARAVQLLELDQPEILDGLCRRADWVAQHDESGTLANHHALAALGLARMGQITGRAEYLQAARERVQRLLDWQSGEGWFPEYGGADPGYQTLTIDCLAKYQRLTSDANLDEPLRRAVDFARHFLHLDQSYAGEYGSRGTHHFYAHGFELLASRNPAARELADGFLRSVEMGRQASFDDDRMFAHRPANLLEAWLDWAPTPAPADTAESLTSSRFFEQARLLARRAETRQTIVSAARGGVFKHFVTGEAVHTDTGLVLVTNRGRMAVSQLHDLSRAVHWSSAGASAADDRHDLLRVAGPMHWARWETATPVKQAIFHVGMWTVGRWCRTLVRRLLQRRLITARRAAPIWHTRCLEFLPAEGDVSRERLRIKDCIEILDPKLHVESLWISSDLQATYVAAAHVYQSSVLCPWRSLNESIPMLNRERQVTIERTLP